MGRKCLHVNTHLYSLCLYMYMYLTSLPTILSHLHVHSPCLPSFLSPLLSYLPYLYPPCLCAFNTDIAACSVVSVATVPEMQKVLLLLLPPHPLLRICLSPLTLLRQSLSPAEAGSPKVHSQSVNLVIAGFSLESVVQRKYTKRKVVPLKMTFCLFLQVGKSLWVSLL